MKRISFLWVMVVCTLFAAEAPVVANKAEFVYPDFSQCYEKNKASIVYFGTTRAIAVSEKYAVAYSKEKPNVPFVKHDYLSHLYLFESPKPLMPVKLKTTHELKLGEWLGSMTDKSIIAVNASKIGKSANDFFEFGGAGEANAVVGGLCCEMYGLGIGDKFFIGSEVLEQFVQGKTASFPELGVRIVDANESVQVDFVDPTFKEARLKAGDRITLLNGKKVSNVQEFGEVLKSFKDLSKVSAQVQRNSAWIEENILAPKVQPKKVAPPKVKKSAVPKKESYLQTKGFSFDNDLRITQIKPGSFAEKSGLKIGDRLMQVETTPISRVSQADESLRNVGNREIHLSF